LRCDIEDRATDSAQGLGLTILSMLDFDAKGDSTRAIDETFCGLLRGLAEEKLNLLEVTDDSLLLKISFSLEYKNRMISIEEKEPIAVPFKDFKVEDWGDGVPKITDIE
jgi:hypothetical protein